ncbi:MAG: Fic family protein [Deltaproteobacteria bacterium]|nr:Fic family protein [Deltaproteobacteria bacterium]
MRGHWKKRNNEIVELLPNGERHVRFVPTSAKETPKAVERLCGAYRTIADEERVPPLLTIATFVFDFLCVHPFRDGNGRVSRLLTTLLLKNKGFDIARYVSLERLVEETKEDYYRILHECSVGWHEGRNEIVPGGRIFCRRCDARIWNFSGGSRRPRNNREKALSFGGRSKTGPARLRFRRSRKNARQRVHSL